jgi:hypothetical protein
MLRLGEIEINYSILCEDIRQELNNKFILLGVFSGDIKVSNIPAMIPLMFFVEMVISSIGSHTLYLRLSGPGAHSAEITAAIQNLQVGGTSTLVGPKMEILFDQEGTFILEVSEDQKTWHKLLSKKVELDPSLNPSTTV